MGAHRQLTGTVKDKEKNYGLSNVTMRLDFLPKEEDQSRPPVFASTNKDGKFQFDLSDLQAFPAGEYLLAALHPDAQADGGRLELAIGATDSPIEANLKMTPNKSVSNLAGMLFFIALVALLGALSFWYLSAHGSPVATTEEKDAFQTLRQNIALVNDQVQQDSQKTQDLLVASLHAIEALPKNLTSSDSLLVKEVQHLVMQAQQSNANNEADFLRSNISAASKLLKPNPAYSYFWTETPWRYVEVIFFALLGILFRLITDTGYYISRSSFYGNSILHKFSLTLSVPILAVAISFILSFMSFKITVGDTTFLPIDLSNVYIAIVVAFLIGIGHWKAWEFMNSLADFLFGKLKSLVGSGQKENSATA